MLHFSDFLAHARHYIGRSKALGARLRRHQQGRGSAITRAAVAHGLALEFGFVMMGCRHDEKMLKRMKNASRYCLICRGLRM